LEDFKGYAMEIKARFHGGRFVLKGAAEQRPEAPKNVRLALGQDG
jgi:hypothetical protein